MYTPRSMEIVLLIILFTPLGTESTTEQKCHLAISGSGDDDLYFDWRIMSLSIPFCLETNIPLVCNKSGFHVVVFCEVTLCWWLYDVFGKLVRAVGPEKYSIIV